MVKLRNKRSVLFSLGLIERKNVYFKPGEIKELPDTPVYSEIISNAINDGFLEVLVDTNTPKKENLSKKADKHKREVSDLDEIKAEVKTSK